MKAIIFSDSHGSTGLMHEILQEESFDMIIHLGDCYDDMLELRDCYDVPVLGVVGNVDRNDGPEVEIIQLDDIKILLTHGHVFRVKGRLDYMLDFCLQKGVHIGLYGHTHEAYNEDHHIRLFNPGSISRPKGSMYCSYGILDVEGSNFDLQIKYIK
jgi:putative phosphoesterase